VELGYPDNNYRKQGPKPTTFSVRCAGFVHRAASSHEQGAYNNVTAAIIGALLVADGWSAFLCYLPAWLQGERALGFVLENQGMIDKTLLFDIELERIQK
jgi:hypothetical protein